MQSQGRALLPPRVEPPDITEQWDLSHRCSGVGGPRPARSGRFPAPYQEARGVQLRATPSLVVRGRVWL